MTNASATNASASAAAGGVMPGSRDLAALPLLRRLAWQDYAELALKGHLGRLLDYGCGNGEFLSRVGERCDECQGVDVDADALPADGAIGHATCRHVPAGASLPFPDNYFDTVTILEVIEHVASERRVL
ncbi:MAG TPA: methyltransferase domain-containing protein, partial [Phycisphaerae bacterium]|nr:methyltransferase domain-containing protein [Phycisphaerae bacterium]